MVAEIEDFLEGFNQPTHRGMRVKWCPGAHPVSQRGCSGDSRPEAYWFQQMEPIV